MAGLSDWLNIEVRNQDVGKTTLGFLPWATGDSDCTGHAGYCNQKLKVLPGLGWEVAEGGISALKSHSSSPREFNRHLPLST